MAVFSVSTAKNYEGSFDIQIDGDPEIVKGVDLLAVVKAVTRDHDKEAEEASTSMDRIEKRMDGIEKRMDGIDAKLDRIDKRLEDIIQRSESPISGWCLNGNPDIGNKWMATGPQVVPVSGQSEKPVLLHAIRTSCS